MGRAHPHADPHGQNPADRQLTWIGKRLASLMTNFLTLNDLLRNADT